MAARRVMKPGTIDPQTDLDLPEGPDWSYGRGADGVLRFSERHIQ